LISYDKKNLTTTFIQLLRTKTIKNKIKNKYSEKNHEKKEKKSYLKIVASEAKEKKKFHKAYKLKKN
jgi:intergrase/recombinase